MAVIIFIAKGGSRRIAAHPSLPVSFRKLSECGMTIVCFITFRIQHFSCTFPLYQAVMYFVTL